MAAFLSVTSAVFALLDAVTFGVPFGSKAASSGFAVRAAGVVCFSLLSAPLTVTLQEAAMDASDFRKAVMVASPSFWAVSAPDASTVTALLSD